jgi:hypothetical protein
MRIAAPRACENDWMKGLIKLNPVIENAKREIT